MTAGLRVCAAIVLLIPALPRPGLADAVVIVAVTNVRSGRGSVRAVLCVRQEFLTKHCKLEQAVPAHPGKVEVTFPDVAPGHYAVQAWHDENGDGVIERDLLGIPFEGVGFSRDPRLFLGPPRFRDAEFTFDGSEVELSLRLRYYKG